ncbi:Rv3235 family protein [Amycolatopsis anabasis]|uniref:Rv3235 family protein n=1 Tax=Amycolatopsis anabasis TaxID=1840409 RepID=UPI00131C4207|nr:Rv3235 family protein [Amycolatopsis anabasis]
MTQTLHRDTRLRPLTRYEPPDPGKLRARIRRAGPQGQLELDLRAPSVPPGRPARAERPPLDVPQLLAAMLEVADGRRAPAQLQPLLLPDVYQRLLTAARVPGARRVLRSVRTCRPSADTVEACGTVRTGDRAVALAARFERSPHGWRCVAFDLLAPPRRVLGARERSGRF